MMMNIKNKGMIMDGIYNDMRFEEYQAIDRINGSTLVKMLTKSEKHLDKKMKDNNNLSFGRIFHEYVLEDNIFQSKYDICEVDKKTMKAYKDMKTTSIKPILLRKELDQMQDMYLSLTENPYVDKVLKEAKKETTILFTTPNGLKCKGRIDLLHENNIIDLKTCSSAQNPNFASDIIDYGYLFKMGLYMYGMQLLGESNYTNLKYIAIEKEDPYICEVYNTPSETVIRSIELADLILSRYKDILENPEKRFNNYSGHSIQELEIPIYKIRKIDNYIRKFYIDYGGND